MADIGASMTEFMTRSRWSAFDKAMALMVAIALLLFPYAGRIEGVIFPVADDFSIEHYETVDDGHTRIWGKLTVERTCDFIATEWYLVGESRQFALPPVIYEPGPVIRPIGRSEFGPWRLNLDSQFIGQLRGVAIHQCPFRPWRTQTLLYP